MPPKRSSRIYWRGKRAWADFRDYADVGGGREPLVAEGERYATTDLDIAQKLVAARLRDLTARRSNKTILGIKREGTLAEFAAHHLVEKARAGKTTTDWLEQIERHLNTAIEFFGESRDLASIAVSDIQAYASWLAERPVTGKGWKEARGTLGPGTRRQYLNSISNLYRRAAAEQYVPPGYNPVSAMMDKPTAQHLEADWLEAYEAALLLEAARIVPRIRPDIATPYAYPLIATYLLTGGRVAEVLGLEVDDIIFDRKIVIFRPNNWRRVKNRGSHRPVPLWPQLEAILRDYIFGGDAPLGRGLLFRSTITGEKLTDIRRMLDAIAEPCGWPKGAIRAKMFRHTYCAARLQTLDRGVPVSPWTVGRELGHDGHSLVNRVYGHLGDIRHRSEQIEYRVDHFHDILGHRLAALNAWLERPTICQGRSAATGKPCRVRTGLSDEGLCLWHDPDRREEAKRRRRRKQKA